jgi:hypothetical protein
VPHRLDGLARYEVHLDRKLERTLTMLLKLQPCVGPRTRAETVSFARRAIFGKAIGRGASRRK